MKTHTIGITLLGAFLFLLSLVAMTQINSPIAQRDIDLDEQRVRDFQAISQMVNETVSDTNTVPTSLQTIHSGYRSAEEIVEVTTDPLTKQPYTYEAVNETNYQLCTTFATDTIARANQPIPTAYAHKKGYDCIVITVPQSYFHTATPTPAAR